MLKMLFGIMLEKMIIRFCSLIWQYNSWWQHVYSIMQNALRSHCTCEDQERLFDLSFIPLLLCNWFHLKRFHWKWMSWKQVWSRSSPPLNYHTQGQSITHSFRSQIRRRVVPRSLHIHVDWAVLLRPLTPSDCRGEIVSVWPLTSPLCVQGHGGSPR